MASELVCIGGKERLSRSNGKPQSTRENLRDWKKSLKAQRMSVREGVATVHLITYGSKNHYEKKVS